MTGTAPEKPADGGDFWSRRKAAVAAEEEAEAAARDEARVAEERADLDAKTDAEILQELGLQDPDTLEQGDDFASFLRSEVPDRLRRRALRRLWRSNPTLANLDNLVDYGDDFTDAATVVDDLQTAYRVGKGMLAHIEAQLAAAKNDDADTPSDEPADTLQEAGEEDADSALDDPPSPFSADSHASSDDAPAPPDPRPTSGDGDGDGDAMPQDLVFSSPRRMKIVYTAPKKDDV